MATIVAKGQANGKRRSRGKRPCPLFLHATGQWAKKVNGRTVYFGRDKARALERFAAERDLLLAGATPSRAEQASVRDLVNQFLTSKQSAVSEGTIGNRHFNALHAVCGRVIREFGPAA